MSIATSVCSSLATLVDETEELLRIAGKADLAKTLREIPIAIHETSGKQLPLGGLCDRGVRVVLSSHLLSYWDYRGAETLLHELRHWVQPEAEEFAALMKQANFSDARERLPDLERPADELPIDVFCRATMHFNRIHDSAKSKRVRHSLAVNPEPRNRRVIDNQSLSMSFECVSTEEGIAKAEAWLDTIPVSKRIERDAVREGIEAAKCDPLHFGPYLLVCINWKPFRHFS